MNILYVEDDARDADLARRELSKSAPHFHMDAVTTLSDALARLQQPDTLPYDVVLTDLRLPDGDGLDLLRYIREHALPLAVIIITGQGDEETAVAVMKAGADDYIVKHGDYLARLPVTLEDAYHRFQAEMSRRSRPLRVLYAEHNADDIDLTRRHLERHAPHIRLEVVNTAVEVLQRLRDREASADYDLLLLDYNLPGLNALEIVKELRQVRGIDIPVVFVTGRGDEEVAVQALRLGAVDYVVKNVGYLYQLPSVLENSFYQAQLACEQAALRASEEKYRQLVELAQEGIWVIDHEARTTFVNPRMAEMLGYTAQEMVGKHLFSFMDERGVELAQRYLERRRRGVSEQHEFEFIGKDGRRVYALLETAPVLDDNGNYVGAIAGVLNITARKRAARLLESFNAAALAMEQALTLDEIFAAAAEEFRKLGFSCMVFAADESRDKLSLRYASYEDEVLLAIEELVGIQLADLLIPIEKMDVYRTVVRERQAVCRLDTVELLRQVLPPSIKERAEQVTRILQSRSFIVAPLIVGDEVIGVLSVQSDDLTEADVPAITAFAHQMAAAWRKVELLENLQNSLEELERTQAQLIQAQKMEAVGRLAGGVAHDFNNLLTAIIGNAEFLLMSLGPGDPLRRDVEEIKTAADRAAALTRQLLAFSRKQILQPKVLNLNVVVTNIEKMLRRLIGEDIELVTILAPDLGQVRADPGQLDQVIMNLAVNARDAMPRGGKLTIETKNVYLDEDYAHRYLEVEPGPYVMLAVSDSGVGMDEETMSHLFEPFFTTKDVGEGTGLGLATVYGIIKQSGGHITVYSEVGQGTTFRIYLPRIEEAGRVGKRETRPEELLLGGETVLLVEDADMVRELARRVLAESGYTVLVARDGEEAMRVCAEHKGPIHLLVTDVVMPGGMSGRDLAERLASRQPQMKVLYMSGYTDEAIVRHGILEPDVIFLQKPFTPAELTHKVREALEAL
ncbi:MAG: response regulator [Anaerolineae bacterium]|nr:response regulator [Anaerolineae bacterium]